MKTAESVFPGHPDKVCDQIADTLVDGFLKQDPNSRTAIEILGNHGTIFIGGEVTTKGWLDIPKLVNDIMIEIGYNQQFGVISNIVNQSPDIAQGVDKGGAGDQGIMIGFATKETKELMPKEVVLAHKLAKKLYSAGFGPDGKTQITLDNEGNVDTVVMSAVGLTKKAGKDILSTLTSARNVLINPTGKFEIGGFDADTGATGRKIVVDQYGPNVPVGGGAFSGKDATKVDRSAAYMARKVAVDLLKKHDARKVLVKLAYVIGIDKPVMAEAKICGSKGKCEVVDVNKDYDLRPLAIIERLGLRKPVYKKTASFGHFGRGFPWDK
jgi:S-adenosylmethionine synthetase